MSMWGIFEMLPTMQLPAISLPTAKLSLDLAFRKAAESIMSRRYTVLTILLGTSTSTVEILSGMGAIRTLTTPRDSARSPARLVSLLSLTPASSSRSYRVTVGPRVISEMEAPMPKLRSVASSRSLFSDTSSRPSEVMPGLERSRSMGG